MRTVNIHEAKTHLSSLIDAASKGEPFVIAKAGHPLVKVSAISEFDNAPPKRLGFLKGCFSVPEDFDELGHDEIEALFGGRA